MRPAFGSRESRDKSPKTKLYGRTGEKRRMRYLHINNEAAGIWRGLKTVC